MKKADIFNAFERLETIAQQLYWLARLPASKIIQFFGKPENLEEQLASDPLSPLNEQFQGLMLACYSTMLDEKVICVQSNWGRILDPYAEVRDFLEIIASTQNRSLFMSNEVSKEGSEEPTMDGANIARRHILNKIRKRGMSGTSDRKGGNTKSKCTGVDDLCERLMDGLVNQSFHPSIHASAVSYILIPGILPWIFREKFWRTLGEMRLLHLAECPLLTSALVMFLDVDVLVANYTARQKALKSSGKSVESVAVVVAMVDTLLHLRSYHEERAYSITRIGLFSIAYYIFSQERVNSTISGMKETLLMKLIDDHTERNRNANGSFLGEGDKMPSVLLDVLTFSTALMGTEEIVVRIFESKKSRGNEKSRMVIAATAVDDLWRGTMNRMFAFSSQNTEIGKEPHHILPCLQFTVGTKKELLIDILKNRCPELLLQLT